MEFHINFSSHCSNLDAAASYLIKEKGRLWGVLNMAVKEGREVINEKQGIYCFLTMISKKLVNCTLFLRILCKVLFDVVQ